MSIFLCDIIKLYFFRISNYNTLVTSFLKNKLVGEKGKKAEKENHYSHNCFIIYCNILMEK